MRSITIRYQYEGPEEDWREVVGDFIAALDADPDVSGKFEYQVSVADDGKSRVHWGRWDSQETLKKMQASDYFKIFAERLKELAGGTPETFATDVVLKTKSW
jgi:quinol monooxygenase YgiN